MKITLTSVVLGTVLLSAPVSAQTIVSVPHFDSIGLEGGGHVVVRYGSVQQVRLIEGDTQHTRFEVEDGRSLHIEPVCNFDCPQHYRLEVEITTPRIDALAIEGGGAIESEGDFPAPHKLDLAIRGGGKIDARSVNAERVTAAVDGGGHIALHAEKELTAAVNGGGHIAYWGNPQVTQAINGGGHVGRGD